MKERRRRRVEPVPTLDGCRSTVSARPVGRFGLALWSATGIRSSGCRTAARRSPLALRPWTPVGLHCVGRPARSTRPLVCRLNYRFDWVRWSRPVRLGRRTRSNCKKRGLRFAVSFSDLILVLVVFGGGSPKLVLEIGVCSPLVLTPVLLLSRSGQVAR